MANGNLPGFLRAGPKCLKFYLKDMIYCFKNCEILTQKKRKIFSLPYMKVLLEMNLMSHFLYLQLFFFVEI